MKVLVIGGSGLIGSVLCRTMSASHEVSYTFHKTEFLIDGCAMHQLDTSNYESVKNLIETAKPDIVIHASAIADVDICENNKELAYEVNVLGTKHVVNACMDLGIKIVFISSASVFDGKRDEYYENDERRAVNYYGETKIESENIVMNSGLLFLIVRTDLPYGWEVTPRKKNLALTLLEKYESGVDVREITDRFVNPTYMRNLAEILKSLLERECEGVYHVASPDYISRYEFAKLVAEVFGMENARITPIKFTEAPSKISRANVNLTSIKTEKDSGIKLLGARDGLIQMKSDRV